MRTPNGLGGSGQIKSTAFLASLLVNPKQALQASGLELTNDSDINELEKVLQAAQEHLAIVWRFIGINSTVSSNDWGIGASCCSQKILSS